MSKYNSNIFKQMEISLPGVGIEPETQSTETQSGNLSD